MAPEAHRCRKWRRAERGELHDCVVFHQHGRGIHAVLANMIAFGDEIDQLSCLGNMRITLFSELSIPFLSTI